MSMLPEEFPVVLTVFMAMGAWRISRARVLTRRSTAIEALGSATVLCTDKTGTLTENRMSVAELRTNGDVWHRNDGAPVGESLRQLIVHGVLASAPERLTRWKERSAISRKYRSGPKVRFRRRHEAGEDLRLEAGASRHDPSLAAG